MTDKSLDYLTSNPKRYLFDGCKLLYHQDKLQQYLDGKDITPIHIDMGIHKWCNIRCVYCYGIKQKPTKQYIPEDRLLMLAEDAKDAGIKSLAIIGDGEPTLNKGLYSFVTRAKTLGLDVSVATNGLLLDDEKIATLTRNLTWLRFNISAVYDYDRVMGAPKGSIYKFESVVQKAVGWGEFYGCTIGLQMVLIPQCFDEIIPLAQRAVQWGVDYLVIKQYSDPVGIPLEVDLSRYKEAEKVLKIAEEMSNEKTRIIVKWSAMADSVHITNDSVWGFDRCIDLPFIFQISGDGGCYPCGYLFGNADYSYGNIVQQRLSEILKSKRYSEVISKVADTPLEKLCKGQCRHSETNKFVDRIKKVYKGDLEEALIKMCGCSKEKYKKLIDNPPCHLNFI